MTVESFYDFTSVIDFLCEYVWWGGGRGRREGEREEEIDGGREGRMERDVIKGKMILLHFCNWIHSTIEKF